MRNDFRLSRMLHVLVHIYGKEGTASSEQIGAMLDTHPVQVRRMMAGLREAGYVGSSQGRGGGWALLADPKELTVGDVHRALGEPAIFALGSTSDHPHCPVERAVTGTLDRALGVAQAALMAEFDRVTLADFIAAAKAGKAHA
jgi:DNA-binding IscR family transcriptional regulator